MRGLRKTIEVAGVLLVILAVATPGLPGMVLCIGPDGHFSVETAHAGGCHDDGEEARHGTGFRSIDSKGCCGDCVDVPLSADGMLPMVKEAKKSRLNAPARTILAATSLAEADLRGQRPDRIPGSGSGPTISPALLALRTVVLRT